MSDTCVALLSGGPDALVASAMVRESGVDIAAMFVDYGQRTAARERRASAACAQWLGVIARLEDRIDLYRQVSRAPMLATGDGVSHLDPASEYIPFRNTVLLAHAVVWAESIGANSVMLGSTASDRISPDNSPGFIAAAQEIVSLGTSAADIKVRAPLVNVTKAGMVSIGDQLKVPFGLTWSCQNMVEAPCAACNNCTARAVAFTETGVVDPLSAPT